jgi:phosphate transport system protein
MSTNHIVKSFDEDLKKLDNTIAEMGGLAEVQLADAIEALIKRDTELADRVIAGDKKIDMLEADMDAHATTTLALRQPMADDLRVTITALRTASLIERIGDYAKNIAKRSVVLSQSPPLGPAKSINRMATLVQGMIKDVLDAYVARDVDKAEAVRARDADADLLHTSLFREILTYMMEDPDHHVLHASAVRGEEPGTHRRPCHQHRRKRVLSGQRRAVGRRARKKRCVELHRRRT